MNWPALATLAVVILVAAGIYRLRQRGLSFTLATLIALAAGIPIGLLAGQNVEYIDPIGKIYINVLLACVAPLVFIAIVSSVTSLGSLEKLRSIGVRSIFWLLLSNAFAVVLALGVGLAVAPGAGLHDRLATGSDSASVISNSVQDFTQTVISFFPVNIVQNFSSNDIVPIIIVAVILSIAYLSIVDGKTGSARSLRDAAEAVKPFRDLIEALKLVIFKVVGYVVRLSPYAIVALTATTIGESSNLGEQFWSLAGLLALTWAACFFHAFAINGVLVRTFARVSPVAFFRKIFPAQLTAFSTQSSVGTLPVTTEQLTHQGRCPPRGRILHGAARNDDRDAGLLGNLADPHRRLGDQHALRHPVHCSATIAVLAILGVVRLPSAPPGVPGRSDGRRGDGADRSRSAAGIRRRHASDQHHRPDMARTMTRTQ